MNNIKGIVKSKDESHTTIYNESSLKLFQQFNSLAIDVNENKQKIPKIRNKRISENTQYDILQIDEQIRICFKKEEEKLSEYNKRLKSMSKTLSRIKIPFGIEDTIINDIKHIIEQYYPEYNTINILDNTTKQDDDIQLDMSYNKFLTFYQQLKKLITKYNNISSSSLLNKYNELTIPLISEYRNILSVPIRTSFLICKKNKDEIKNKQRKIEIEQLFLQIASSFIDLDINFNNNESYSSEYIALKQNNECSCGNKTNFDISDDVRTCEKCGLQIINISIQTNFKDIDRINPHQKYRYEKKIHFKEAITQFQGKQNRHIPSWVHGKIEEWLLMHDLIDKNATSDKVKYAKVKKEHLRLCIYEINDPAIKKYREDIHLIHYQITGVPCADISHLEEKLYAKFDKLEEAFLTSKDIDRTNILNVQVVLKNLLIMEGFKVNSDDFPGLKTLSRKQEHESLFAYLCQKAGINYS